MFFPRVKANSKNIFKKSNFSTYKRIENKNFYYFNHIKG